MPANPEWYGISSDHLRQESDMVINCKLYTYCYTFIVPLYTCSCPSEMEENNPSIHPSIHPSTHPPTHPLAFR